MRRLIHLMLSPSCRLARLMVAEKRVACDPVMAEDARNPMPVFVDMDGTRAEGVWAILDHLETNYPDHPLAPARMPARRGALRWVDWAMGPFHEQVTQRIVYEKAGQRFTGAAFSRRARHEHDPRRPRGAEGCAGGNRQGGGNQWQSRLPRDHAGRSGGGGASVGAGLFRRSAVERSSPPPMNGMCG